jgi:predicted amidohydrolase YtcJ
MNYLRKYSLYLCILIGFGLNLLSACKPKANADLLVVAKQIQSMDSTLRIYEAMVIKDGKVLALGTQDELGKKYTCAQTINYPNNYIYAGLIDAHCHFYGLGKFLQMVDLTKTQSMDDVLSACMAFDAQKQTSTLLGRGWDQNKWANKSFPNNEALSKAFPNKAVILKRVDGHAALVNDYALKLK